MAHLLRRAMSAIRYRREQGGMATLFEKSHQETSEGRGNESEFAMRMIFYSPTDGHGFTMRRSFL